MGTTFALVHMRSQCEHEELYLYYIKFLTKMVTSNTHKYIYRLYKQKEAALDFTILTLPH